MRHSRSWASTKDMFHIWRINNRHTDPAGPVNDFGTMKRLLLMVSILSLLSSLFASDSHALDYRLEEAYSELRKMVLSTTPKDIGLKPKPNEVWGVLMETGHPKAVATLVALADGTVSLYFSSGGGVVGLGLHAGPHQTAQSFLRESQQFSKQAQPTTTFPLPRPTFTRFYLLTGTQVLTVEAKEDDLGYGRHPFSSLFHKGHELITEIRKVDNKRRAE
jgi:hypothetical protein